MHVEVQFRERLNEAIEGSHLAVGADHDVWASPICVVDAPGGFGEECWHLEYPNLIAWALRGRVFHEGRSSQGRSTSGADGKFSLQPRFAPGHYRSEGSVRFAHFYIGDGLLRRTVEGLEIGNFTSESFRPDLVLVGDPLVCELLEVYRRRSLDRSDPPSRLEMEARALPTVVLGSFRAYAVRH